MTVHVVQVHEKRGPGGIWVPVHDVSSAAEYGEINVLLSPRAVPYNSRSIIAELHVKLQDYDPLRDWLVSIGNPTLCAWASAIAAMQGGGRLSMLEWNSQDGRYRPVKADLLIQ